MPRTPHRTLVSVAVVLLALATGSGCTSADAAAVTVYKSPTCGCCDAWIEHLEANGFSVEPVDMKSVAPVKIEHGIPRPLASCHTAVVDGYFVEGHVPAADVKRLLAERPAGVAGLTVPGMPEGSPGMEGPEPEAYDVLALGRDGRVSVFASHGP